jgi:hypothetical protein
MRSTTHSSTIPFRRGQPRASSLLSALRERVTAFFKVKDDRDIECFVQRHAGLMSDGLERDIDQHLRRQSRL